MKIYFFKSVIVLLEYIESLAFADFGFGKSDRSAVMEYSVHGRVW